MSGYADHPGRVILLLIIAVSAVVTVFFMTQQSSARQNNQTAGDLTVQQASDNIIALPISLGGSTEGIALIDKTNYTICIYSYQGHLPANERFMLLAARSFRYDVQLESFNTASPTPAEVQQKVLLQEQLRKKRDNREASILKERK